MACCRLMKRGGGETGARAGERNEWKSRRDTRERRVIPNERWRRRRCALPCAFQREERKKKRKKRLKRRRDERRGEERRKVEAVVASEDLQGVSRKSERGGEAYR